MHSVIPPAGGRGADVRGSTLLFKAVGATTGGAFSLHERHVPAGGRRPPAHVHPDRVEAFWVLDGEAEFELDGELTRAAAGSFVLVPGGVAHTFGAPPSAPRTCSSCTRPRWTTTSASWRSSGPRARRPTGRPSWSLMRRHGMRPV